MAAPVGGLNTISAAGGMPSSDCYVLYNMIAAEYGLRARLGYREWCTGLTGAADNQVRTILPFSGSIAANNKLFAATSSGIWGVTTSSDAPSLLIAFGTTTGNAGYGECCTFVSQADGGHFLIYCDEVNGMYVYTQSTDTWAKVAAGAGATEIAGTIDPANAVFPLQFKNRLWLVERNTGYAHYLSTANAIYGTSVRFQFGSQFRNGGYLVGLWSWTQDGGAGIDDKLVAISSGGDVVIYELTDPSTPSGTALKGVWDAGGMPAGRRVATRNGGDLLILSKLGLLPLSRLIVGSATQDGTQYESRKISSLFNQLMISKSETIGWSMHLHPEDNALLVTVPTYTGTATEQLAMSVPMKSWCRYRDLPIYSAGSWAGKLYFGTTDGKVCINDGYVDAQSRDGASFTDITWSLITAYQNGGNGRQKQIQMIRPTFLGDSGQPTYAAEARYRYSFSEVGAINGAAVGGNTWDSGTWDSSSWGGDYGATSRVTGAAGMGPEFAVALKGTSRSRTVLANIDLLVTQGGFL